LNPSVIGATLLAAVLVAVAVLLGFWQAQAWSLDRARAAADHTKLEPVPLSEAFEPDEPFPADAVGRPVTLTGTWLSQDTLYVSGQEQDGRDGYWAVTPVAVPPPGDQPADQSGDQQDAADDPALLVVRGWVADPADDQPPAAGPAQVTAWLQPAPGDTGVVDDDPSDRVVPSLRIADLLQHVDTDLYGGYAVTEFDLVEKLPGVSFWTGARNLFYALEWWVFGAFAGFVWWRYLAEVRDGALAARRAGESDDQPATGTPVDSPS